MQELSLRDEYQLSWIPAIERMLQNEKDHYDYLSTFDENKYPMATIFKEKSILWQQHLTERLAEYIQHFESLPI
jgi:hypothetical protein